MSGRVTRVCADSPLKATPGHPHHGCSGCNCPCHSRPMAPPGFRQVYEQARRKTQESGKYARPDKR